MQKIILPTLILLLVAACNGTDTPTTSIPETSVNQLMVDVITPTTNRLWSVEEPATNEEWQALADAAAAVISASEKIKRGGTGPNDMTWAADPAWQAFADRLSNAAMRARDAANEQDLDALFVANDVLYPPCEECHLQFHPGVNGQDLN